MMESTRQDATDFFGSLWVLVNNAGITHGAPLHEFSDGGLTSHIPQGPRPR